MSEPAPQDRAERRIFWLKTFFAVMALGAVLQNIPACIPLVIGAALMWAPVRARVIAAIIDIEKELHR